MEDATEVPFPHLQTLKQAGLVTARREGVRACAAYLGPEDTEPLTRAGPKITSGRALATRTRPLLPYS